MSIDKEEIDKIVASESLSKTYYFMTLLIRTIIVSFIIGLMLIGLAFFIVELKAFMLIILLTVVFLYIYSKNVRVINDSSNEIWAVYWRYFLRLLSFHDVSEDKYMEYVSIFWNYSRMFGLAFLIALFISLSAIFFNTLPLFIRMIIILVASIIEAFFIRELIIPRMRLRQRKLFMNKVERLQSYKRNTIYLLIISSVLFNFNLLCIGELRNVIGVDDYLLYFSYIVHLVSGVLLGIAYINYYKMVFEVTYLPMRHPLFDIMAPFFILVYILVNVVIEKPNSQFLAVSYVVIAIFALTFSYGYFAISCWHTIYVTLTSIKDMIREDSPRKRVLDVYSVDARRFAFMSVLSPALVGALFLSLLCYSGILSTIPGVTYYHLYGGLGILMGFSLGAFWGYSKAIPIFMLRIQEEKAEVLKLKKRIEKRKAKREVKTVKKRVRPTKKEKLEVSEKDEYERWIKEFDRLARLLGEES